MQGPAPPSATPPGRPGWLPAPVPPPPPPRWRDRRLLGAVAAMLVLALVAGAAVVAWGDGRGERSGDPAAGGSAASGQPADAAGVRAVQDDLERLRGLDFKRPVPVTIDSPDKVAAHLLRELDSEVDRPDLEALARALVLLGELPAGTDLYGLLRSVQSESVLGFYVPGRPPAKGRLYVRSDQGLDPYARIVLSHELTHAVTDQHYDLTRADRLQDAGADDQLTAYTGLLEGDATLAMQVYRDRALSAGEQLAADRTGLAQRTPSMDAAPPAVRESLLFPYAAGAAFVRALYQRGGWEAVNRAYQDPPVSTEQLMHPEKYLGARDDPQAVRVGDLRRALGAGWHDGTSAEWGEFDTRLLFQADFPVATADRVAAGWDGGELRTFERRGGAGGGAESGQGAGGGAGAAAGPGATALVLRTVWDSDQEAREYCTAMARWATNRLGEPTAAGRWSSSGKHGALACDGTRAAWLSAPDHATLDRLVSGLGKP